MLGIHGRPFPEHLDVDDVHDWRRLLDARAAGDRDPVVECLLDRADMQLDLDPPARSRRLRFRDGKAGVLDERAQPLLRVGDGDKCQPIAAAWKVLLFGRGIAPGAIDHLIVRLTENTHESAEYRRPIDISVSVTELNGDSTLGDGGAHLERSFLTSAEWG